MKICWGSLKKALKEMLQKGQSSKKSKFRELNPIYGKDYNRNRDKWTLTKLLENFHSTASDTILSAFFKIN